MTPEAAGICALLLLATLVLLAYVVLAVRDANGMVRRAVVEKEFTQKLLEASLAEGVALSDKLVEVQAENRRLTEQVRRMSER